MTNEMTILNGLRNVIVSDVNQYLPAEYRQLSEQNVVLEFPDPDNMPADVAVFIQGNSADYESLATTNDASSFTVSVFVMVKRDAAINLTQKMYTYFNGVYEALRRSMSLGGIVDFAAIEGAEFYPAVEGNRNVQGAEISCALHYTKDFE